MSGPVASCRSARLKRLKELAVVVPRPVRLLDVGGIVGFWAGEVPHRWEVSVLNVFAQEPRRGIEVLIGDGCDLEHFGSNAFDIVFSNSALAFVGSRARQGKMAAEIERVGKRFFVQTPNYYFPIDWRTLVPFFHWLPPRAQAFAFTRIRVGKYHRVRDRTAALTLATRVLDLSERQVRQLFPRATIERERVLGLTKSFMVHQGFL